MITVTQLRKGVTFEDDGQLWKVLEYDHYKPGRGKAIIRTKLVNLRTGRLQFNVSQFFQFFWDTEEEMPG